MLYSANVIEKQAESELAAFKKKAENEKWAKISEHMTTINAAKYPAAAIEKCFKHEKKENFPHRATIGNFIGGPSRSGTQKTEPAVKGTPDAEDADETMDDITEYTVEEPGVVSVPTVSPD